MEQYTQIGFLITALLAVSGCLWWLVKKVIKITTETLKDNTEAMKDLKHAVYNNTEATKDLRQTLTLINK